MKFAIDGPPLAAGEFWYDDAEAWHRWLDQIDAAVQERDPWALAVRRPDCDLILVDVLEGWRDRVYRFNGRTVWLVQPDGWEP